MVEHVLYMGQKITGKGTCRLDKATDNMDHLVTEALETQLQPNNYNSDGVSCTGINWQITLQGNQTWVLGTLIYEGVNLE